MQPSPYTKLENEDHDVRVMVPDFGDPIKNSESKNSTSLCKRILKIVAIFVLVAMILASLIGFQCYRKIAQEVKQWTVVDPGATLPIENVPGPELEVFKAKAKLFYDMIQAKSLPDNLILSSKTINGFAAHSDYLRGNAFAGLKAEEVKIDVRLPTKFLPGGNGRYLVGTETFTWIPDKKYLRLNMVDKLGRDVFDFEFELYEIEGGKYWLEVVSGQILEYAVPHNFIDEHNNLLEGFYHCEYDDKDCKEARTFLDGFGGFGLEEDQLVFKGRKEIEDSYGLASVQNEATQKIDSDIGGDLRDWKTSFARHLIGIA